MRVGVQVGAVYRFSPGRNVQPYARASGGVGFLGNSYVITFAEVQAPSTCASVGGFCNIVMLDGESTPQLGGIFTLAAGVSIAFSPSYRFRFEARDLITQLTAPSGPAPVSTALAPVQRVWRHAPVLTAGVVVVFERRRGRRY